MIRAEQHNHMPPPSRLGQLRRGPAAGSLDAGAGRCWERRSTVLAPRLRGCGANPPGRRLRPQSRASPHAPQTCPSRAGSRGPTQGARCRSRGSRAGGQGPSPAGLSRWAGSWARAPCQPCAGHPPACLQQQMQCPQQTALANRIWGAGSSGPAPHQLCKGSPASLSASSITGDVRIDMAWAQQDSLHKTPMRSCSSQNSTGHGTACITAGSR